MNRRIVVLKKNFLRTFPNSCAKSCSFTLSVSISVVLLNTTSQWTIILHYSLSKLQCTSIIFKISAWLWMVVFRLEYQCYRCLLKKLNQRTNTTSIPWIFNSSQWVFRFCALDVLLQDEVWPFKVTETTDSTSKVPASCFSSNLFVLVCEIPSYVALDARDHSKLTRGHCTIIRIHQSNAHLSRGLGFEQFFFWLIYASKNEWGLRRGL